MKVNLPQGIDYTKYNSTSGMSTKVWGKASWKFLFSCIMGRYPLKINKNNKEHMIIQKEFKNLLVNGLQNILPCVYCRNSFKDFLKELPIKQYLIGRIELMYWLYLMKDKVNNKLINQEKICYLDEKKRLKDLFYNKIITQEQYYQEIKQFKTHNFPTIPSPPFEQVLQEYEQIRAMCSPKSLTCSNTLINYPRS